MSGEAFSESSAQDTQLAAAEAKEWIEVSGKELEYNSNIYFLWYLQCQFLSYSK